MSIDANYATKAPRYRWWSRWSEPEYICVIGEVGGSIKDVIGTLYKQTHKRHGRNRYFVKRCHLSDLRVDPHAYEKDNRVIFI